MRAHRRLIGLVTVTVLLSGTAVFWLVGFRHEPMPQAMAEAPGYNCAAGDFCGRIISQNGGCTAKECCATNETYCNSSLSNTPIPFPKAVSESRPGFGRCLHSGDPRDSCWQYDCEGSLLCSQSDCAVSGEPLVIKHTDIISTGVICPPVEQ